MSGNNPMKFMNLLQTVGKNIEDKISNGDLDQEKLVEEAQTMMGSLNNNNPLLNNLFKQFNGSEGDDNAMASGINMMQNMMKNMNRSQNNNANNNNNNHSSNATRERLRKKLEARKNKK